MTTVRNKADTRRVFSRINRSTGCWLELDPGQEADVDLPEGYQLDDDLEVVTPALPTPKPAPPTPPPPPPQVDPGERQ